MNKREQQKLENDEKKMKEIMERLDNVIDDADIMVTYHNQHQQNIDASRKLLARLTRYHRSKIGL